jgi:hypothetical protein
MESLTILVLVFKDGNAIKLFLINNNVTCLLKARIVGPEEMSTERQEFGKHISKAMDTYINTYIHRFVSVIIICSYES